MWFRAKMDDKKIKVDLDRTNVKDILQYCKPKEQLVLYRKFGLVSGKEVPLQRIGESYGLTRERVRQIEAQWLMRFRRLIIGNEKYLKVIEEGKKILDMNGWFLIEDDFLAKLVNKWIGKFNIQELKMIVVSDFDIYYLKRNRRIWKWFFIDPLFEDLLTDMTIYVTEYFTKKGEAEDLYEFVDKLKDVYTTKYTDIEYLQNNLFYTNFFKSIKWIATFYGKVGLDTFTEVNPKTIKQKVLYILRRINKPLHYQEMSTRILGKIKRPMPIKEIQKEVLKEKMVSPNTIVLTLQKYKDMFERVDKWVYQLKK